MTNLEAIVILEKIDHLTVIDGNWWGYFIDKMDTPNAIFRLTNLNDWQSVLGKYEGYTMFEFLEEIKPELVLETLTIHDLRGTFELTNSKGEIVKDNLEDYEACEAWAIENGYNNTFNEPSSLIYIQMVGRGKREEKSVAIIDIASKYDPIEQAKELLRKHGYFGITWTIHDILESAKTCGYLIDETQAREIADSIEHNHDCNIGINWENIHFHIREFAEQNDLPELDFVEFGNESYPTREITMFGEDFDEEGESVTISVKSLSDVLLDKNDAFVSKEAESLDETIFFYVDGIYDINLPEEELVELIKESL